MADNYTENSELVRERATEDLFNRDAAPKHSQEHEAEELGSGLEGRASEELFLQSILEGSRDENSFSSGDERETAFEVKGVDHPLTEEGGIGTEGNSASDPVADAFSFSSLREGITEENSGFDLTPNTLSESVSDPESGFGDFSDSGMRQAHPVQQASPLEVEQTSVDAPVLADSELINKAAEARVPSTNGPQKESEINYQPSDITIDAAGIVEGAEGGTLVAVITGIDPNPGEALTYSIDNDPSGIFELVGNQLFLKEGANIDYEESQTHSVALKVTDTAGNSFVKVFYIEVEDINETPTLEVVSSVTVEEDGSKVISFNAVDVDAGDTVHTIASAANGTVTVDGNSGEITYTPNQNFNGSDTITVTTTDDDGAQVVKTISVTVSDINDAPTLEVVSTATVDEDGSKTISFSAGDLDGTVSTTASAANGTVTVDGNSGEITYTPDTNFNGSDTITVTTTDDDGAQVVKTVSVTVNAVADAPTLTVTLGNPSAVSGQDCSANGSYANWQASGVGMHAFTAGTGFVDAEGKLNLAAANGTVGDEPGLTAEGIGVVNSTPGGQASYQLEYGGGQSEALALDLNGPVSSAQVTLSRIYGSEGGAGEDARYSLFDADGNLVGSGSVDSSTLPNTGGQIDLTLTANTSFQYVVFTATGDNGYSGSDFKIKSIDYSIDADIEYPLEINAALNDLDGSETLSITVEGLPDGAVLSAGSDNGDGSWTLEGNQLNGLTLTVPENLSTGFDLTVSATATESDGGTAVSSSSVRIEPLNAIIGSTGDDLILGTNSGDLLDGAEGNDQLEGLEGDDILNGGQGSDHIEGGSGDDVISGGAGDDVAGGGDGNDTYIFNPFEGNDSFDGGSGGGWTDVIRLDANADPGADPDNPWTISIDGEQVQYDLAAHALELNPDTSGVITLSDGSELTFDGIERIEW